MKVLVVGAGLTGAVIARELAMYGCVVEVIDKRTHVAGNAFDTINEHGIRIHRYGPHIFHTNNETVFNYLSTYTEWLPYKHKVKALLADGRYVVFPPNRETAATVGESNLLDIFFRPYTRKMWGMELEELNPVVIQRVSIRDDLCDLYFPGDRFQAFPQDGYTTMVDRILDHQRIGLSLSTPFDKKMECDYHHVFNCMPIDEYYDYQFGELPYRSIQFKHEHLPKASAQPVAVINFTTNDGPTRCTEWVHFPGHSSSQSHADMTTLTTEYPCDYRDNDFERYYPVMDVTGNNLRNYRKYAALSNDKTTFTGRCGNYVYIDMHQAVNMGLTVATKFAKKKKLFSTPTN